MFFMFIFARNENIIKNKITIIILSQKQILFVKYVVLIYFSGAKYDNDIQANNYFFQNIV